LARSNETFIFVGSGTQILPFNRILSESWYGSSRKRLFNLISKHRKSGVILLSGDIHCAQVLKTFCTLPELGYDLYEITSSGLSHFYRTRIIMDYILPNDYSLVPTVEDYNFAKVDFYFGNNKNESYFDVSIIDADSIIRTKMSINYKDLLFKGKYGEYNECSQRINSRFKSIKDYYEYYKTHKYEIVFLIPYLWLAYLLYVFVKFSYRLLLLILITLRKFRKIKKN
jgi:hypothetical protein